MAGCAVAPAAPTTLIPFPQPASPTFKPPAEPATLISSPTVILSITETPSNTPTIMATDTATETLVSYVHVFPVQPAGDAGYAEGTSSHGYPATDIFAPVEAQFVAVTDGEVDFISSEDLWDPVTDDPASRGGLSVAIIGDDGLRYYGSHLSAISDGIAPGVHVKAGQLLGLIGNSGDARSTLPHLHFGISRPSTPDDWKARRGQEDPFPFLQAWRDGHNVTPPLPNFSDTPIPSETPTRTPNLFPHIFPIQPPGMAGFSAGGHAYLATDIFAPLGTKFVAATNGTVDEVSYIDQWNPTINDNATAGGLSVRIIGDDGLRYYGAHLSKIALGIRPGIWVPAGQLLGLVGNTGDAGSTAPHVHFEISSSEPPFTKADPFPFLVAWLDGKNISPFLPAP
jgi:peptidoglycan LD-endopeptidase LytH